jgi:hypothetical protein
MSRDKEWDKQLGKEIGDRTGKKIAKIVAAVIGGIFLFLVLGFLFGWFVQFLWNETLASMFDWPPITYWEAVGLFVLAKILLGFGQPGRAPKHKNKTTEERDHAMVRQWWRRRRGLPEDRESDVPTSAIFQAYWREAGKAAYEAYLARDKDKEGDSPPST